MSLPLTFGHISRPGFGGHDPLGMIAEYGRLRRCVENHPLAVHNEPNIFVARQRWQKNNQEQISGLQKSEAEDQDQARCLMARLRMVRQKIRRLEDSRAGNFQQSWKYEYTGETKPRARYSRLLRENTAKRTATDSYNSVNDDAISEGEKEEEGLGRWDHIEHPRVTTWVNKQVNDMAKGRYRQDRATKRGVNVNILATKDCTAKDQHTDSDDDEEEPDDPADLFFINQITSAVRMGNKNNGKSGDKGEFTESSELRDLRNQQLQLQRCLHVLDLDAMAHVATRTISTFYGLEHQRVTTYLARMQRIKRELAERFPHIDLDNGGPLEHDDKPRVPDWRPYPGLEYL